MTFRKRQRTGVSALHRNWMEDTMFDKGRRPIGRLFYWIVTVMMIYRLWNEE
jgi:hypothetical protein